MIISYHESWAGCLDIKNLNLSIILDFIDRTQMVWFGKTPASKGKGVHHLCKEAKLWNGKWIQSQTMQAVSCATIFLIVLVSKGDITYSWSILVVGTMMYTYWQTNTKWCIRDCFNPPLVTTNTIVQTPSPPIFPSQDIWLLWLIKWSCRTDCQS